MKKLGLFLIFLYVFSSFSFIFKEVSGEKLIVQNTQVSLTIDGNPTNFFPLKSSNLKVNAISCNDSVYPYWDYESWSLRVKNVKQSGLKCSIDFVKEYNETLLNGAIPELKNGMVPVIISNDGTVRKADISKSWYSYEEKKWANGVILKTEQSLKVNEIILMEDIESFFVWIPRYKYKIFNDTLYHNVSTIDYNQYINKTSSVEIIFENKLMPKSNGTKTGEFLTHPAFTTFDTNGIWIGKYETSFLGAKRHEESIQNIHNPEKIEIKPNQYIWTGIKLANMHLNSYEYKREYNSHMIKNTEWGSVAFLQYSKYGMGESNQNNHSDFMTGFSSVHEQTGGIDSSGDCTIMPQSCNEFGNTIDVTEPYNTFVGAKSSTTGNITGIYDMSGGSYELVMGFMVDDNHAIYSGLSETYNTGFNGKFTCPTCDNKGTELINGVTPPNALYYDAYENKLNGYNYDIRILGDATSEMGPFYVMAPNTTKNRQYNSWDVDESYHIGVTGGFQRGGGFGLGLGSGVFAFNGAFQAGDSSGYRIVFAF